MSLSENVLNSQRNQIILEWMQTACVEDRQRLLCCVEGSLLFWLRISGWAIGFTAVVVFGGNMVRTPAILISQSPPQPQSRSMITIRDFKPLSYPPLALDQESRISELGRLERPQLPWRETMSICAGAVLFWI